MSDKPESNAQIPQHVGIILDGNRRWAKAHHLPRMAGHKAGYENVKRMAEHIVKRGVKFTTVYAFSTENWNRQPTEINYIFRLFEQLLVRDNEFLYRLNLRFHWMGLKDKLDPRLVTLLETTEAKTAHHTGGQINVCFNYGGRADMVEAVKQLIDAGVSSAQITPDLIASHLQTAGVPDPDLIIRTSGEQRLSNFLLWEGAYAELYFTPVFWPDFDEAEFDKALAEYAQRKRRFGG